MLSADHKMDNLTSPGLSIAHLNVRSLLAANTFDLLKIQIQESGIDIFGLSETWLSKAIPMGFIKIKGYKTYRHDRSWSDNNCTNSCKKGGGLVCYIKDCIQASDTKYAHFNRSCKDVELQWVSISIKNMRPVVILNVYRPPQGDYKQACKIINESITKACLKNNTEIFLMGDFNIDLKVNSSPETKELLFTTGLNGLIPKIIGTTRRSNRAGNIKESCIDNIFTNSPFIAESKVLDLNISDHLAVYVRRKKARIIPKKIKFTGRSYKNFVKEDFQEALLDLNWDDFYNATDPGECWNMLESAIRGKLNQTCPIKTFRVKEVREPWVTNELLEEIRDKDNYLKIAKASGREDDWILARRERNRVGKLTKNARTEFVEQQREYKSDPKKFWKVISTLVPNNKHMQDSINLVDQSTGKEVEEAEVANHVNEFFSSIGPNLANKISESWTFWGNVAQNSCQEITTDYEEVLQLCKDISVSKSSGILDIATKILKHAFMVLIPQLVYMFNLSFSTGIFPDAWKKATVIPLFKSGDREMVGNYRPISLLPTPAKIIEKIAHKQMSTFLERNSILSDKQNGFRKGCSTASAVADFTDDIFQATNNGEVTIAVFVDLRKAFDTVCHEILCKKIEKYGLRNKVLNWCINYLKDREQVTLANNIRSKANNLTFGVPQGSVLGPLLFILYVNDIQHVLNGVKVQMYADDTVIYASGKDLIALRNSMQSNLNIFHKWCCSNKLTLNPNKTKMVNFGTKYTVKRDKKSDT